MRCLSKFQPDTPSKDDLFLSASQLVLVLPTERYKLCRISVLINKSQLRKEAMYRRENVSEPSWMCFYGRGNDLTTGFFYKLKPNPQNPKDDSCIELTENGLVKTTMNARLSKLMAPRNDNAIIPETKWYD